MNDTKVDIKESVKQEIESKLAKHKDTIKQEAKSLSRKYQSLHTKQK